VSRIFCGASNDAKVPRARASDVQGSEAAGIRVSDVALAWEADNLDGVRLFRSVSGLDPLPGTRTSGEVRGRMPPTAAGPPLPRARSSPC